MGDFRWENLPWDLLIPLFVIELILIVVALIDCIRNKRTNGPKWLWVLIIIVINLLGPVLYFVIGRRASEDVHH